jgi:hypothetical protein
MSALPGESTLALLHLTRATSLPSHTSQTMAFQSSDNNGAYATGQQQQQTGFGQGPTDRAANAVPVST